MPTAPYVCFVALLLRGFSLGLVVGPAGSPTLYFVHADHLSRAQKVTDGSQAIVWAPIGLNST